MDEARICGLNYEAEYNRSLEEIHKLTAENERMEYKLQQYESKINVLNGKMEIINLIFGK